MMERSTVSSISISISQENFDDFIKNIKGIISKLMRKMVYDGQGIGKRSQGVIKSIVAKHRNRDKNEG